MPRGATPAGPGWGSRLGKQPSSQIGARPQLSEIGLRGGKQGVGCYHCGPRVCPGVTRARVVGPEIFVERLISATGQEVAQLRIENVLGSPGVGVFRLQLAVTLSAPGGGGTEPVTLAAANGDLYVNGKPLDHLRPLGSLLRNDELPPFRDWQVPLVADLSLVQLEALEAQRRGGDLTIAVHFHAALDCGVHGLRISTTTLPHTIPQSEWVRILSQMGYQRTLLLEVPVPDSGNAPEMAGAVEFLAEAQRQMIEGHYRQAVGSCRDALEQLAAALQDGSNFPRPLADALGGTSRWPKAERLRLLRRALTIVTHPAKHGDPMALSFEWDREDARSLISMTAAVISEMRAPQARPNLTSAVAESAPDSPRGQVGSESTGQ